MWNVSVNVLIPLEFNHVEGNTRYEAAENVRKLIENGLPIIINTNIKEIKDNMIIEINEIENGVENESEN